MSRTNREKRENEQFRLLKEKMRGESPEGGRSDDSPATAAQCAALKSRGIFATPNTHTISQASALLEKHGDRPSAKQVKYAKFLGIGVTGLGRSALSDAIDAALKARKGGA